MVLLVKSRMAGIERERKQCIVRTVNCGLFCGTFSGGCFDARVAFVAFVSGQVLHAADLG